MNQGLHARLVERLRSRPLQALILVVAVATTAAAASPLPRTGAARTSLATAVQQAVGVQPPPAPLRLVWEGVDLDGDGRADFANPTGQGERGRVWAIPRFWASASPRRSPAISPA